MPSVYAVCWIFLQTFQTYFCIWANSVDPDQTAPDLGPHCLQKWLLNHLTKQTTIVAIGALRVKSDLYWWCLSQAKHYLVKHNKYVTFICTQHVTQIELKTNFICIQHRLNQRSGCLLYRFYKAHPPCLWNLQTQFKLHKYLMSGHQSSPWPYIYR